MPIILASVMRICTRKYDTIDNAIEWQPQVLKKHNALKLCASLYIIIIYKYNSETSLCTRHLHNESEIVTYFNFHECLNNIKLVLLFPPFPK